MDEKCLYELLMLARCREFPEELTTLIAEHITDANLDNISDYVCAVVWLKQHGHTMEQLSKVIDFAYNPQDD